MSSLLAHIERLRRLFAEAAAASARFQSFVANNPAGRQDEVGSLYEEQLLEWLWDNVELHLLGCARGIAIVEDRYRPELNPNVALEWGWMKGMGRPVLYRMEKRFQSVRADWHGLIASSFSWSAPESDIDAAVRAFLQPGP